jgi:hypothetical protein
MNPTIAEPTALAVITAAERELCDGRTPPTQRRYARARARLEAFFESLDERMLTTSGAAMLELERDIQPAGALLRVAVAEDVLYALPAFVRFEPSDLPVSEVRAQHRLAEFCYRVIAQRGLVDLGAHICAVWEVEGALRRARAVLKGG